MKPILFSTPMVQSILEGRKTQTRRIIKPQPRDHDHSDFIEADWKDDPPEYINSSDTPNEFFCRLCGDGIGPDGRSIYKSRYVKGDILWVRETFQIVPPNMVFYKADAENKATGKWKPSIFMPREAARIFLEVTNVRVERLHDISEEDAIAEGIVCNNMNHPYPGRNYMALWDSINGFGSSKLNPWVWVYEFKRVNMPRGCYN